jgi:hypothetical protein
MRSGVDPLKLYVMHEAVDVHFYSPFRTATTSSGTSNSSMSSSSSSSSVYGKQREAMSVVGSVLDGVAREGDPNRPFVFLSVFKCEGTCTNYMFADYINANEVKFK